MRQSQDQRSGGHFGGITFGLVLLAIASFLAAYNFNDLTSTIKSQGKDLQELARGLSVLKDRQDEVRSIQAKHGDRLDTLERTVDKDEVYLGLRRTYRDHQTPPQDGGAH